MHEFYWLYWLSKTPLHNIACQHDNRLPDNTTVEQIPSGND